MAKDIQKCTFSHDFLRVANFFDQLFWCLTQDLGSEAVFSIISKLGAFRWYVVVLIYAIASITIVVPLTLPSFPCKYSSLLNLCLSWLSKPH